MKPNSFFLLTVVVIILCFGTASHAANSVQTEHKCAIVLDMLGTNIELALRALLNIRTNITTRFTQTKVRIAFTSNFIRKNGIVERKILSISTLILKFPPTSLI